MEMVIVIVVLLVLGAGIGFFYKSHRENKHVLEVRRCLDALLHLKVLLIYLQRHRGLSTGYLQGDRHLESSVREISLNIVDQWKSIENSFPEVASEQLYEGISNHWQRLDKRWKAQTISNNIEQHNRLIINLLYLIENHAESNALLTRFARKSGLHVIWKELLETIEAIGQTRAIGMGVVGAGESSTIERIQLKFLNEKVAARLERIEKAFEARLDHKDIASWSVMLIEEARGKTEELRVFIEDRVLEGGCQNTSSDEFFTVASAAISPLDNLFGEATKFLGRQYG